ncbi:hypothetical protein DEGR_16890 [Deinococcus grandis]|nr:hypothetical protein DEGR_16890 [Deinococcus grandis]
MRYLLPNGTAGLLRFCVSGARRLPCPPARIIPRTRGFMCAPSSDGGGRGRTLRVTVTIPDRLRSPGWAAQPASMTCGGVTLAAQSLPQGRIDFTGT